VAGVEALAEGEQTTPFAVFLVAWWIVLGFLSKQRDFVVGVDFSGRSRRELEQLVGLFVNQLPLRADLSGDPTCRTLLARATATARFALERQEVPAERIVEAVRPQRREGGHGLFQAKLSVQNRPPEDVVRVQGLELRPVERIRRSTQADLTLNLFHRKEALFASLEYDAGLFEEKTAGRWAKRFADVLALVVADPEQKLSELEATMAKQQRARLVEQSGERTTGGFPTMRRKGVKVR
jgi:non-ribosomal peptide synthetase component F